MSIYVFCPFFDWVVWGGVLLLFILFFIIYVLFHFFTKDIYFYNQKKKSLLFILKNPQTPSGDLIPTFCPISTDQVNCVFPGQGVLGRC